MDRLLDRSDSGPLFLRRPEIAERVVTALLDGDGKLQRYQLHAFVVMPNHVHLLVTPKVVATRWLAPLKGFTAFHANELLNRHGQAFWQEESYDHLVRSGSEFDRIRAYIEENPVTAGLVSEAEQYPWSSAASRPKRRLRPKMAAPHFFWKILRSLALRRPRPPHIELFP